ncbi:MAG: pentapeptide repeat-containing protein [Deltaproteobacteria bacterium]|nr:pentapeptide repeat-containing protein [Deltaproteobacteria bacterium]
MSAKGHVDRAAAVAALPRMAAPFPMQVMGEFGLNHGDTWWMDARLALFWCPEWLPAERTMRARIDLRKGVGVDLDVVLITDQIPCFHGGGYLHLAQWSADAGARAKIEERIRVTCAEAFLKGYEPPRLPAPDADEVARRRPMTEAEHLQRAHEHALLALATRTELTRKRRASTALLAMGAGLLLGALAVLMGDSGSLARMAAFRADPVQAARAGVLRHGDFAGVDFPDIDYAGVDLREARLVGASLAGRSLPGARLSESDLRRADLSSANLRDANLVGAQLDGADLRGADLRGADATTDPAGANFAGALYSGDTRWLNGDPPAGAVGPGARASMLRLARLSVPGAELDGIDLAGARIGELDLSACSLRAASLSRATLAAANFAGATLTGSRLDQVACERCNFAGAELSGAEAARANMNGANLSGSTADKGNWAAAQLVDADLSGTRWTGVDLRGANLSRATLASVTWEECLLFAADLTGANLSGARMARCAGDQHTRLPTHVSASDLGLRLFAPGGDAAGAKLPPGLDLGRRDLHRLLAPRAALDGVKLAGSNLSEADLSNASLREADLEGALLARTNLAATDLHGARLHAANLRGANLSRAKLCGADLTGAELQGVVFTGATACATTRWPQNKPPRGVKTI